MLARSNAKAGSAGLLLQLALSTTKMVKRICYQWCRSEKRKDVCCSRRTPRRGVCMHRRSDESVNAVDEHAQEKAG